MFTRLIVAPADGLRRSAARVPPPARSCEEHYGAHDPGTSGGSDRRGLGRRRTVQRTSAGPAIQGARCTWSTPFRRTTTVVARPQDGAKPPGGPLLVLGFREEQHPIRYAYCRSMLRGTLADRGCSRCSGTVLRRWSPSALPRPRPPGPGQNGRGVQASNLRCPALRGADPGWPVPQARWPRRAWCPREGAAGDGRGAGQRPGRDAPRCAAANR